MVAVAAGLAGRKTAQDMPRTAEAAAPGKILSQRKQEASTAQSAAGPEDRGDIRQMAAAVPTADARDDA